MKRLLFCILMAWLMAGSVCWAAEGLGTQTRGASFSTTNSMSWTSPSVSGSNVVAVVGIHFVAQSGTPAVTWGGATMTEATGAISTSGSFTNRIFYLVAPAAGTSTVAVSTVGTWLDAFADAGYFTGVDQTTPIDQATNNTGASSNSFSGTCTTDSANEYIFDSVGELVGGATLTATNPTTRWNNGNNSTTTWAAGYQLVASAGSPTMAWTSTGTGTWQHSCVSLTPAPVPASGTLCTGPLLGVGPC